MEYGVRAKIEHDCEIWWRNPWKAIASTANGGPEFIVGQQGQKLGWKAQQEAWNRVKIN